MDDFPEQNEQADVQHSSAVPAYRPPDDPGLLSWVDLVRFGRRNFWMILGASMGLGVVVFLGLGFLRPPEYQAVATLVIAPQRFRSELKPATLPVQGYQRLLESNSVIAKTERRLREMGVLEEDRSLILGDDLMTRIFVSRRAEETTLAPMIEVVAKAATPEAAATIANTWSETFLELADAIQEESVGPLIELIGSQYDEARGRLAELRVEEIQAANEYQVRLDRTAQDWDLKQVAARKRTEDLVAAHNVETRSVMERFAIEQGLSLDARDVANGGEEGLPGNVPQELEKKLLQILALRTQLAQTPRLLVLEKAISDDTLWQTMALSENGMLDLQPVLDRKLITEEANPVHDRLIVQLAEIEVSLDSVPPGSRTRVHRFTAGLERIQAERTAELAKLLSDRSLVMDDLNRQRAQALRAIERERRMKLDEIGADIAHQRQLFQRLAETRNEAGLADAEQVLHEVRLGAPAVPPGGPEPRRLLFLALVAAFVGGLLGLVVSLVREVEPEGA